ncbi:hypothetical protein [Ralstonia pseudosolanacearum]|uniref:recombination directionality factor n=1 Tax=Ralstonia pseudosolanacearum TaxID=1310165 RepID=UPI00048D1F06|nr:hypothetical protein [Ralstonia pseudosolanacearum]MDO3558656.1 hypothetical protein [Ralstonia pseudosolanacearum]MDO3575110.1 hypothetical protein [Ralstonia pseudosolanacearum]MDO3584994.1 hypothetical protein [Ralstonia pseudosolanacearum]
MIKGLAITPPVIGRISIGKLVQRNDKFLPEKDDSFTLTTQVQNREGWLLHPLHQPLADQANNGKIRAIPIHVPFNSSELNLRAEYSAFDRTTGRPLCVGNGETARRVTKNGLEEVACPGPDRCPFAQTAGCKLYGRLNVQVDGQQDELGTFIFRTTGYNSVRTLAARLRYFEAVSGGVTHYLPLLLRLRAKSTTQSYRTPVYYVDLTLRDGAALTDVVAQARQAAEQALAAGIDTTQLEAAAKQLLQNGQFEDTDEDVPQLLEEFYPDTPDEETDPATRTPIRSTRLTRRLGNSEAAA